MILRLFITLIYLIQQGYPTKMTFRMIRRHPFHALQIGQGKPIFLSLQHRLFEKRAGFNRSTATVEQIQVFDGVLEIYQNQTGSYYNDLDSSNWNPSNELELEFQNKYSVNNTIQAPDAVGEMYRFLHNHQEGSKEAQKDHPTLLKRETTAKNNKVVHRFRNIFCRDFVDRVNERYNGEISNEKRNKTKFELNVAASAALVGHFIFVMAGSGIFYDFRQKEFLATTTWGPMVGALVNVQWEFNWVFLNVKFPETKRRPFNGQSLAIKVWGGDNVLPFTNVIGSASLIYITDGWMNVLPNQHPMIQLRSGVTVGINVPLAVVFPVALAFEYTNYRRIAGLCDGYKIDN